MTLDLDGAIKHYEEKAIELRVEAEELRDIGEYTSSPKQPYNVPVKAYLECANEHEQLAEWLRDYKRLLTERQTSEWIDDGQYAENYGEHAYRCKECGCHIITHPNMLFENRYCKNCGADMRKGGAE